MFWEDEIRLKERKEKEKIQDELGSRSSFRFELGI